MSHYHPEIGSVNDNNHSIKRDYGLVALARAVPSISAYPTNTGRKVIALIGPQSGHIGNILAVSERTALKPCAIGDVVCDFYYL